MELKDADPAPIPPPMRAKLILNGIESRIPDVKERNCVVVKLILNGIEREVRGRSESGGSLGIVNPQWNWKH